MIVEPDMTAGKLKFPLAVKTVGATRIEESELNAGSPLDMPDIFSLTNNAGLYQRRMNMRSIFTIVILFCGFMLIPATIFADGERRYEAIRVYNEQDESCVFILDTKVGYIWTWERNKIGDKSFTTLQFWGMVEIGKKMGEVIDTTLPKRLMEKFHKNN